MDLNTTNPEYSIRSNPVVIEHLRQLRNLISHRPNGLIADSLAQYNQKTPFDLPVRDLNWFYTELFRGNRYAYEHFVPQVVIDVVRHLVDGTHPQIIVDPWAGLGVLAANAAEACNADRVVAYGISDKSIDFARQFTPQIDWRHNSMINPQSFTKEILEDIDLVVCNPPLGMLAPSDTSIRKGEVQLHSRDIGESLLAASALKLSADGLAIFVLPAKFFSKNPMLVEFSQLGLGVEAALELPAGSFAPYTSITTYLVVVRRRLLDKIFVARLSENINTNRQIVKNFKTNSINGSVEMGRLVEINNFKGIDALIISERLDHEIENSDLKAVKLSELSTSYVLGKPGSTFTPVKNAIYVPLIGNSGVIVSEDELRIKPQNYAQVVIDPKKSDASFVAKYLNSELGQLTLEAYKTSGTIPRLNSKSLQEISLYLPTLETQREMAALATKISEEGNLILSLQGELNEIQKDLWEKPSNLKQLTNRLENFSRKLRSNAASQAEETFEQWIETLPFPLASILRAWQAEPKQDYKSRYEHLLQFFEATAEFLSVIYLSAFSLRKELYVEHLKNLNIVWQKQHLSIERASFGTWKVIIEYFSKQIRTLLSGDSQSIQLCSQLFGTTSFARFLSDKELAAIMSITNKMRNDWKGHGGIVSPAESNSRNQKLMTEILKLRSVMSNIWSNVQLVRALWCKPKSGQFENDIALMMGSNSEFLKDTRIMSTYLDVEKLCLVFDESGKALELLPLIQVGPSPESAKNACYFFNRIEKDGMRFVSYHSIEQPERKDVSIDASEAIRLISIASVTET